MFKKFAIASLVALLAVAAYAVNTQIQEKEWKTDYNGSSIQIIGAGLDTLAPFQIGQLRTDDHGVVWRDKRTWPAAAAASALWSLTANDTAAFTAILDVAESASGPWVATTCSLVTKTKAKVTTASNATFDTPSWSAVEGQPTWGRVRVKGTDANSDTITFSSIKLRLNE